MRPSNPGPARVSFGPEPSGAWSRVPETLYPLTSSDLHHELLGALPLPAFVRGSGGLDCINKPFSELVGLSREELLGSDVAVLWGQEGKAFFSALSLAAASTHPVRVEVGEQVHRMFLFPFGELEAGLLLPEPSKELEAERVAVLRQLAGAVAHQLRNPLGALVNAVAVLERALDGVTGDAAAAIEILEAEAWRANQIVTELVGYARPRLPQPHPVELSPLVEESLRQGRGLARCTVNVDVPEKLWVLADPQLLQESVGALIANAAEATALRGSIGIKAERRGELVALEVCDDGKGIEPEVREQIFEPLFTTKPAGLGLGLATARNALEAQGGRVRCLRHEAGNTCFSLEVPWSSEES